MTERKRPDLSAAALHILAMALMLADHLHNTLLPDQAWLGWIGRLAFPIFAFLLVEGYHHTRNFRRYCLRLLLAALLSEIPFDLMAYSTAFYPFHQNVLWTFLVSLLMLRALHWAQDTGKQWIRITAGVGAILAGYLLGYLLMCDYYGPGVMTVLVFDLFRGRRWWQSLGQLLGLGYIHTELLGGLGYEWSVSGSTVFLPQQGFAVLALLPIWLYRGRQGFTGRGFRLLCYGFYPAHMLFLWLLRMALTG